MERLERLSITTLAQVSLILDLNLPTISFKMVNMARSVVIVEDAPTLFLYGINF